MLNRIKSLEKRLAKLHNRHKSSVYLEIEIENELGFKLEVGNDHKLDITKLLNDKQKAEILGEALEHNGKKYTEVEITLDGSWDAGDQMMEDVVAELVFPSSGKLDITEHLDRKTENYFESKLADSAADNERDRYEMDR